jgi:phage FluMu protein Com
VSEATRIAPDLVPMRCPDCGSLLLKTAPQNGYWIEVRCRKCKHNVSFEGLQAKPRWKWLDSGPGFR